MNFLKEFIHIFKEIMICCGNHKCLEESLVPTSENNEPGEDTSLGSIWPGGPGASICEFQEAWFYRQAQYLSNICSENCFRIQKNQAEPPGSTQGPKRSPRAPKATQGHSKRAQGHPKGAQGHLKGRVWELWNSPEGLNIYPQIPDQPH